MNYKCERLMLCILFSIGNGQSMDTFLGGVSSVNNFVQSASNFLGSDTEKGILSVVDSVGKSAQGHVDANKKRAEEEKKRAENEKKPKEYFKETDYYIDKDNNLCMYKENELLPLGKVEPNLYIEDNIYYLDDNPYMYTKRDAIEPTIGHLKTITLEENKYYKMDRVAHCYKNGKLQKVSVGSKGIKDITSDDNNTSNNTNATPQTKLKYDTSEKTQESKQISQHSESNTKAQDTGKRLTKIKNKLKESINLSKKNKNY